MVSDILQPTHLLFILVVALLVLGPKRLPEVGRQLGSGLRDFRAAINGERREETYQPTAPPPPAAAIAEPAVPVPATPLATDPPPAADAPLVEAALEHDPAHEANAGPPAEPTA